MSYHDPIHLSIWLKSPQGYPLCDKPLYSDIHPASQLFSEPDKALGRVGGELDILARDRVDEAELIGVQALTAERGDDL